jgi:hypothetical protein
MFSASTAISSETMPNMEGRVWKAIRIFSYHLVILAGAVSCVLVWLKIDPKDLWGWHVPLSPPHWAWLLSAILLFVVGMLSSGYSLYQSLRIPQPKEQDVQAIEARLPVHRPRIIPLRYGKQPDGHYGLFIENSAEPAFDVCVATPVAVGEAKLVFQNDFPSLTMKDGTVLLSAYIEKRPHDIDMGDLFEQMRLNGISAIDFPIDYKDGDNKHYRTNCKIERDVLKKGGLAVRFISQEVAPSSPSANDLSKSNMTLAHRTFDAASRFKSEARDFLKVNPVPSSALTATRNTKQLFDDVIAWRQRFRGWFKSKYSAELVQIVEELAAQGLVDHKLNSAIGDMNSMSQNEDRVAEIVQRLRFLASSLD